MFHSKVSQNMMKSWYDINNKKESHTGYLKTLYIKDTPKNGIEEMLGTIEVNGKCYDMILVNRFAPDLFRLKTTIFANKYCKTLQITESVPINLSVYVTMRN